MSEERASYCRICAASCGILVDVDGDRVVGVRGDPDHPASKGYTCPKGRALGTFHHAAARLDHPRLRGNAVTWEELLDDLAAGIGSVRDAHGDDAIGFYLATGLGFDSAGQVSSMTWFASLGSRSVYTAVTVDNAPVLTAAELVTGQAMLNPVWDPGQPGLLIAFGINPVVSHGYGTAMADPITHLRRYRALGGRVWVLDPRRSETAAHADRHLAVRPGSDTAVLAWLCGEVLRDGVDADAHCAPTDLQTLRDALRDFTLDRASAAAEADGDELLALLAEVRANRGRLAVMCGTGLTMSADGVLAEWLRWVLLVLTGSLDRETGMRFNRGEVMRLRRGAYPPVVAPGPPSRPELRPVLGQYPCVAMVDEIEAGNLRALVIGGGNPLHAFPDIDRTRDAFASLDVLAVVDVADSELTALATHVLPATGQLERADITLAEAVSMRSGIQYTPAVVTPVAERRPVWWIFGQLARRMGGDILGGADPDDLTDELFLGGVLGHSSLDPAEVVAAGPHGIDVPQEYGWVAGELLPDGCWQVAPPELIDRLARHHPPGDAGDDELILANRRDIRRLNSLDYAGEAVGRDAEAPARLHPGDAARHGIVDGNRVRITSAHGQIDVVVRIDAGVRPGTVSMNHGRDGAPVAALTSATDDVDPLTGMPWASGLPVRLAIC
ncbi:MAG: putative dehydrogenase [Acidimicrobiales bacterium]|nr:putative dehydrogenase [Acidimicrobiales bacterium]